jgi:hypothetical protein
MDSYARPVPKGLSVPTCLRVDSVLIGAYRLLGGFTLLSAGRSGSVDPSSPCWPSFSRSGEAGDRLPPASQVGP